MGISPGRRKLAFPISAAAILAEPSVEQRLTSLLQYLENRGIASRTLKKPSVDLMGVNVADESKESRVQSLRERCDVLRKVVEAGRQQFPFYSAVIDKYVLDDTVTKVWSFLAIVCSFMAGVRSLR